MNSRIKSNRKHLLTFFASKAKYLFVFKVLVVVVADDDRSGGDGDDNCCCLPFFLNFYFLVRKLNETIKTEHESYKHTHTYSYTRAQSLIPIVINQVAIFQQVYTSYFD